MSARTCAPRVRPSSTASAANLSLRRILHAAGTDSPEVPVVRAATSALAAYWNGRYAAPPFASPVSPSGSDGWCARKKTRYGSAYSGACVRSARLSAAASWFARLEAAAFTEAARRRACATTSESASFAAARASPRPHPATSASGAAYAWFKPCFTTPRRTFSIKSSGALSIVSATATNSSGGTDV